METCRLTGYPDLEWALQQVRMGHSVLVLIPRPRAGRREVVRHLNQMQSYMAEAQHEAVVSGVRHAQIRRFRPGQYVSQFTLSPRGNPGEPTPVREPLWPSPDAGFGQAALDLSH